MPAYKRRGKVHCHSKSFLQVWAVPVAAGVWCMMQWLLRFSAYRCSAHNTHYKQLNVHPCALP